MKVCVLLSRREIFRMLILGTEEWSKSTLILQWLIIFKFLVRYDWLLTEKIKMRADSTLIDSELLYRLNTRTILLKIWMIVSLSTVDNSFAHELITQMRLKRELWTQNVDLCKLICLIKLLISRKNSSTHGTILKYIL